MGLTPPANMKWCQKDQHMETALKHISLKDKLVACPDCSYTDGFHIGLIEKKDSGIYRIILICPNCHQQFEIGWGVQLAD